MSTSLSKLGRAGRSRSTSMKRGRGAMKLNKAWRVAMVGWIVAGWVATAWAGDGDGDGEKYALLVGVSRYNKNELRDLPYPDADVEELAQVLLANGYRPENVMIMTQKRGAEDARFLPSSNNIRRELGLLLQDREEGDTLLIGLAGHGVQIKGKEDSYFCPYDARLADETTLVSIGEVYRQMERCQAGLKLLLVDACRNNPQSDNSRARAVVELASEARPRREPPGGVVALFSCSASEKAYEHDELKHGVFFHYVIEGLRGQAAGAEDQGIMVEDLARYVKRRVSDFVRARYGERQMPELKGQIRGLVPLVTLDAALTRTIADLTEKLRLNPKDDAAYNNRGNAYLRKGDATRAIDDYDASLRLDPTWAQGYVNRARAYAAKGDVDRVIADCTEAIRLDPKHVGAYSIRGHAFNVDRKDYARALADFGQAARLDATNASLWNDLGIVLQNLGRLDEAIADFGEAIRLDPKLVDALIRRGNLYTDEKKQHARAITDYTAALAVEPRNATALANRALAREAMGDRQGAIADTSAALAINPRNAGSYLNRARVREAMGDHDGAIADYDEALRIDPRSVDSLIGRGYIYAYSDDKNDRARALADYDAALAIDPKNAYALLNRGITRVELGDRAGAFADYDAVLALEPKNVLALLNRGLAYLDGRKDFARAFADMSSAIRLEPENALAYCYRAKVHGARGEVDEAFADCAEALRHDPNLGHAFLVRGNLHHEETLDYARALADYTEAVRLDPKDTWARNNRGHTHFLLGHNDLAITDLDEAIRLDPHNSTAHDNRAKAYRAAGDATQALADYQEVSRLLTEGTRTAPQDPEVHNSLAWFRASSLEPKVRDGKAAVAAATRACELTGWKMPFYFDALAAAHAESGDFATAIEWQRKALQSPESFSKGEFAKCRDRLDLYVGHKPFRE